MNKKIEIENTYTGPNKPLSLVVFYPWILSKVNLAVILRVWRLSVKTGFLLFLFTAGAKREMTPTCNT